MRDPLDRGDPVDPYHETAALGGLVRYHLANLLAPLGHPELADALRGLANGRDQSTYQPLGLHLSGLVEAASQTGVRLKGEAKSEQLVGAAPVGGIVTRAGPLADASVPRADLKTLENLNLRPVYVGVEPELAHAALDGSVASIRAVLGDGDSREVAGLPNRGIQAGGRVVRMP